MEPYSSEAIFTNPGSARAAAQRKPCLLVGFTSRRDVTGQALAFDLLLTGLEQRDIPYRLVDLGMDGLAARPGSFDPARLLVTLKILYLFCLNLRGVDQLYLVVASSQLGFLRDACMIWLNYWVGHRLIIHLHGGGYRTFYESQPAWLQQFIARTIAHADKIIVLGEQLRDQFAFVPNYAQKICTIPNGLPLELHPKTLQPKSLPATGPLRLLYLSNLMPSKGYLVLLEACRILTHERGLAIHCDFCGNFVETMVDTPHKAQSAQARFFQLIKAWELTEVVTYHGVIRGAAKEELLQQAHALVLPTSYPWEGQPLCIIEALAFGTPVVATPHRGILDQVSDQYNGFLVAAEAQQVAAAVEKLGEDPAAYQQLSQQARQHFVAHFTQEKYLERLITVIIGGK
ncbi:MAG: glycosyltransferase family 4 protein [Caldilineaceae bacterium]|nr:glycosyltransferase family 4 protein [Caldilineaceae bacterium]